ncbi:type II CRISPR-associated endonuclease Cas1 [Verrucomicrobiaceae bacterium 227]
MAWRGIHLSRPTYLSLEHQSLKLDFRDDEGGSFRIPLEDLSYLIIDTAEVSLSGRILSALSESSVMVLGSDTKHLPSWAALPWTRFYKQGETLKIQLNASLPQQKQLWAQIVKLKIQAQAHCLDQNNLTGSEKLNAIATQIKSGDPDNTEARAARLYWSRLFPDREFRRHDDDFPNACLNYAYALLRAALARHLCALGFVTQLGIHHESLSNAYNLADDLIEPYRPIADHFSLQVIGSRNSKNLFS